MCRVRFEDWDNLKLRNLAQSNRQVKETPINPGKLLNCKMTCLCNRRTVYLNSPKDLYFSGEEGLTGYLSSKERHLLECREQSMEHLPDCSDWKISIFPGITMTDKKKV